MKVELPGVNTLVRIEVEDGLVLPSRVETVEGPDLVLAAPTYVGNVVPPELGDVFAVGWTGPRGVCGVPADFVEMTRAPMALWRVRVAGGIEVVQRRRFVRAPVNGPVSFATGESEYDSVRVGSMLDLSEGGVRVRLTRTAAQADDTVLVRMSLDGDVVSVTGTILRAENPERGFEEVIVTFDDDHPQASVIRRFVFAEQARQRRSGTA